MIDGYLESEGVIIDDMLYTTTGNAAQDTLGLSADLTSRFLAVADTVTFSTPDTTGIAQVSISGISGLLYDQPISSSHTNLTQTVYVTGEESYSIVPREGEFKEYQHSVVYFLGER